MCIRDRDYTLKGLSLIKREKIDAIREAIKELERAGYIVRSRERDEKMCRRDRGVIVQCDTQAEDLQSTAPKGAGPFFRINGALPADAVILALALIHIS